MISLDSRDFTKTPPAYLDPLWVLRMQRKVVEANKESREWPYGIVKTGEKNGSN